MCRPAGVPVIVNDRVDVALAAGAAGVHVGQDDLPAAAARRLLGPNSVLGVSVKTVEQAMQAQADGADYLGAGAGILQTIFLDASPLLSTARQVFAASGTNASYEVSLCLSPGVWCDNGMHLCQHCGLDAYQAPH